MAQIQGTSSSSGGRLDGSLQRTTLASSHFTLGAGWGTTPILAITSGSTDQRGSFTITADATPTQATATIVITFADGAYASAPFALVNTYNDNDIDDGAVVTVETSTTALTMVHSILPVDTKVYTFHYVVIA